MLKTVKALFIPTKDYAGRNVDRVIERMALQTSTQITDWSYIREESLYENTVTGMKVYPHEVAMRTAA